MIKTSDMMPRYYRIDGTTYDDVLEWAKDFEKSYKDGTHWIGRTKLWWGGFVSTVHLGLDHNFFGDEPLIFETMVFVPWGKYGRDDVDQIRYSSLEEAKAGHAEAVRKWFIPYWLIWESIDDFISDAKRWLKKSLPEQTRRLFRKK